VRDHVDQDVPRSRGHFDVMDGLPAVALSLIHITPNCETISGPHRRDGDRMVDQFLTTEKKV
jgi:hypothetical protein